MTGTIGKFFFQFGVTVGIAVFLSLICALTLTPMLCAFFLNLHEKKPHRPRPFRVPLAVFVGGLAVLIGACLRLTARFVPEAAPFAWPILALGENGLSLLERQPFWPMPEQAKGNALLHLWVVESFLEFLIAVAVTRYGNVIYWAFERIVLGPLLLWPTEWLLDKLARLYAVTLRWSLRLWPAVLLVGVVLIAVAGVFLYYDLLGRELVPSEDQSRLLVHVICPVGSSIQQVSELLARCENILVQHDEVAGVLTTV